MSKFIVYAAHNKNEYSMKPIDHGSSSKQSSWRSFTRNNQRTIRIHTMKTYTNIWISCMSFTLASGLIAAEVEAPSQKHVDATTNTAPDNTKINLRDRDDKTLTPEDQSGKEEDVLITKNIRQAVMKDKSLSILAQNVKIITIDNKVTLRGPVNTKAEKKSICAIAKKIAGKDQVDDQLEIKTSDSTK